MRVSDRVTVICITHNHEEWIEETLESVRLQDHYSKELIIVDNGSKDKTVEKIRNWVANRDGNLQVSVVFQEQEKPYCQVFNEQLDKVTSPYVVDLSGDDVMYPEHLSQSVKRLKLVNYAAFVFSDAYILTEDGEVNTFYKRDNSGELVDNMEELGDIYVTLVRQNYICSPTMVFQTEILKQEGGYDGALYYEDFDIQVRLARKYPVVFSNHIGVLKRRHPQSLSSGQYKRYQSQMLPSTVEVCKKILDMNTHDSEDEALGIRVMHELKHALWSANFGPAKELVKIGEELDLSGLKFWLYKLWLKKRWDISWVYQKVKG
ncbi:glycosyltransferase family 2 protein [Algoriphagus namhaensis]